MTDQSKTPFQILSDELDGWLSADELRTLRKNEAAGGTLADFSTAIKKAHRQKLDPLQDHVFFLSNYDKSKGREVLTLGVSIAGLRSIAQSTGEYAGQKGPFWCGPDGEWTDVWLKDENPAACKVGVMRTSFEEPLWNVARWDDYAAMKNGSPMFMWADMGPHMLAKCSEANGIRRAFPDRVAELYIPEEMERQQEEERGEKSDDTLDKLNQSVPDSANGPKKDAQTDGRNEATPGPRHSSAPPHAEQPGPHATGDHRGDQQRQAGRPQDESEADGSERADASGPPVEGVSEEPESGPQSGAGGPAGQSTGSPPNASEGGQGSTEQPETISTGKGSQLNYLFAKGVHDGPYTKDGLKQMVEREFQVPSIDDLPRDKFDEAKERLSNDQMADRYNREASGKAGTDPLPFDEEEGDSQDEDLDDGEVHVRCDYCGAEPGEACQSDSGEAVDYFHKARTERFKMRAGDVGAYVSRMEAALDDCGGQEAALEIIQAVAIDISDWPEEDWEEVVSRLEHFHDDAREECDLRRTPEFS